MQRNRENNRLAKTRDLFKKITDTKGILHAKMGSVWYGPNRSKYIKKRWQEYTELYKKDLYDPDNHECVITHLEPDILEGGLRKHYYEQR